MEKRRKYADELKLNAINLSKEPVRTLSSVGMSLVLPNGIAGKWRRELEKKGSLAFPGNGNEALTPDQKRIRDLEKQLKDVQVDKEILKKAVAIFSKLPK